MRTSIIIAALFISEAIEKAGKVYEPLSKEHLNILGWVLVIFFIMDVFEWIKKLTK
jgi:hypothetical protein